MLTLIRKLPLAGASVTALACRGDRVAFATWRAAPRRADVYVVAIHDSASPTTVCEAPARVTAIALAGNGDLLLADEHGGLRTKKASTAASMQHICTFPAACVDLAFLGKRAAVAAIALHWPPLAHLDLASASPDWLAPLEDRVPKHLPRLAVSPNGHCVAFGHVETAICMFNLADGRKWPWPNAERGTPEDALPASDFIHRMWFRADSNELAVTTLPRSQAENGPATVLHSADLDGTNHAMQTLDLLPTALELTPDFAHIVGVRRSAARRLIVLPRATMTEAASLELESPPRRAAQSESGEFLALALDESLVICHLALR